MQGLITTRNEPIRTVLHLSPTVTTAALQQAQRHNQPLNKWLEGLVVQGSAGTDEDQLEQRMSNLMAVELFAHVASNCPGAFTGRWKLLFERCLLEEELWRYPEVTLDEAETGVDCQPSLNRNELLRRWPQLVASVWLVSC